MGNLLYEEHNKDFFDVIKFSSAKNHVNLIDSLEKIYAKVFQLFPDTVILANYVGIIIEIPIQSHNDSVSSYKFKVGKSIFGSFPNSIHHKLYDAISNVIDKETPYSFNYSSIINDKEYHSEVNFLPLNSRQFIVFIKNVTSNILIQKALTHSEHLFRSVWQSSLDGLRLIKQNGEIYAVNSSYCNMVGSKEIELIGKQFYNLYKGFENIPGEVQFDKSNNCDNKKNMGKYIETTLKLKDGRTISVEVFNTIINPRHDHHLNFNGEYLILSIFRDITEKRLAHERLLEAQKFNGFGEMSAYITHELKTPLATIKLNLQMLKGVNSNPSKKMRSMDLMLNEVSRLERLIHSVLDFSKNSVLIPVKINLKILFQTIMESLACSVEQKEIQIIINIPDFDIFGDYQKLYCAFLNLLENSIDAIQDNGMIELESSILDDMSGIIIYFKDNGCGIEDRDKIYDPFFSTKDTGTGLGLTIVKKIIEQHQGQIVLYENSPNKTVFEVYLPCNKSND
jgi:PAS domain S-box-containing protein